MKSFPFIISFFSYSSFSSDHEISKLTNSVQCTPCSQSEFVNSDKTECIPKEVMVLGWSQPSNALVLAFSLVGILSSAFCFCIYIIYQDTPVVKATSMELSLTCLVGIVIIFIVAPLFVSEATDAVCQTRYFLVGVGFSVLMGALLMKTNRISRIFNRKLSDGRPSMLLQIKVDMSGLSILFLPTWKYLSIITSANFNLCFSLAKLAKIESIIASHNNSADQVLFEVLMWKNNILRTI